MDVPGYALITGAASGIGRACAFTFAQDGCAGLSLLDRDQTLLQTVESELRQSHPDLHIVIHALDVTDESQVTTAVESTASTFGRLDYVVNAAGVACKHKGGVAHATTSDWRRVLNVNLDGSFFVLRATAKIMLDQSPIKSSIDGRDLQRGSIVNFSSLQGLAGIAESAAYGASKHAIIGLTRSASEDYAGRGLRINAVCPGYTETPLTLKPEVLKVMEEKIQKGEQPIGRMGTAREIADAVVWLSGGRASFVTGAAIAVDGGYTQR
ncbi:dehydrogenase with different specificitie [Myriangium duriaei CBS 260.36]|uniref:Dehydrogenase with different specificitie n=1 Tax=Myriangium duriaei CBS 260.36 TaxID=1168546 RepID=A0A9P4MH80_9PEZI|nr:dehydrogenase with different specificitie [Myriangium duriaei CBS 260.36]